MSYPRVNLLKKSEQRYQGAVSSRFIITSAVMAPVLVILLISGLKVMQYFGIQRSLNSSEERWQILEPQLKSFNETNSGLTAHRQVAVLFEGWQASQVPFEELMDDIQDVVPENIQFNRLSIRGNAPAASFKDAESMKLDFSMVIDGSSQGNRAEDDVIEFQRELLRNGSVNAVFKEVNLAWMRKRQSSADLVLREFRLEGKSSTAGK